MRNPLYRALTALCLVACGDGSAAPRMAATVRVQASRTSLRVRDSLALTAVVLDASGNILPSPSITWASNNSAIVQVNQRGVAFAVGAGTATVTATADGKSGEIMLTSALPAVASVTVSPNRVALTYSYGFPSASLSAVLRDSAGYVLIGRGVTWTSSDTTVATVSGSGAVTARRPGQTTFSATSESVRGEAAIAVSPVSIATVLVRPDSIALELGKTWSFSVAMLDSAGRYTTSLDPIVWSSNDTTIAAVSSNGTVSAVGIGTSTITAAVNGKRGSAPVRVFPSLPVGALVISPETATVLVGSGGYFNVLVRDSLGNRVFGRPVAWSVSNSALARIGFGNPYEASVGAVAPGTVTVIASSDGKQGTATMRVSPWPTVARMTVTPDTATLVVGRTLTLSGLPVDSSGAAAFGQVTWRTSDSAKAIVSSYGAFANNVWVTAVSPGVVTITATANGKSAQSTITVAPLTPLTLASTALGRQYGCGITTANAAYCWGLDFFGVRGDGSDPDTVPHPVPARVSGSLSLTSLTAGQYHVCGVATTAAAYCWGANMQGQLGTGTTNPTCRSYGRSQSCSAAPVPVTGGLSVRMLGAGAASTCALTIGDFVYCWGANASGQLGSGSITPSNIPIAVSGARRFTTMASGDAHVCALASDGTISCWGSNSVGQLGAPTAATCTDAYGGVTACSTIPLSVAGAVAFVAITAGGSHSCALSADGVAYCWGSNSFGELGNGSTDVSDIPMLVAGGLRFRSLSAGGTHTCGISTGGATYCWGSNLQGQLGTGTNTSRSPTPALVAGRFAFSQLSAGATHTCGIAARTYCWGSNSQGELGTGTTGRSAVPAVAVTAP